MVSNADEVCRLFESFSITHDNKLLLISMANERPELIEQLKTQQVTDDLVNSLKRANEKYVKIEDECYTRLISNTMKVGFEKALEKCPRCKKKTMTIFSAQLRSADEPEDTFYTCHNDLCGFTNRT